MSFRSSPLFSGDLYDSALRLASSPDVPRAQGQGHALAGDKWQHMLNLGWQGVLVAEEDGGVGARLQDVAAIVEAAARQGQSAPLADRCAVAPILLTAARAHPEAAALLSAITLGEASVCPAWGGSEAGPGRVQGPVLGADGLLMGTLSALDLSEPATHILLHAHDVTTQEAVLVLLPWSQVAAVARHHVGVDEHQYTDIALEGVQVTGEQVLLRGAAASDAVTRARHAGSLLTCVQAVGAAAAMIELTIDYLNTRVQFGVALSTFQALRHRTVEMYVAYENISGLVSRLIRQADEDSQALTARDVVLAKFYAADVARMVSESSIQLHGGMGMTWEMLAARLAVQTMTGSLRYGDRAQCLDWLTAQTLAEAA